MLESLVDDALLRLLLDHPWSELAAVALPPPSVKLRRIGALTPQIRADYSKEYEKKQRGS